MYFSIPEPTKKVSKEVVKVWRISEAISNSVILAVLIVCYYLDFYFSWKTWIGLVIVCLIGLTFLAALWGIFIEPPLKQKYWRYDVSEEFIQLKWGVMVENHQLVPMTKVQSVELTQGPLQRKYQLYSIKVGTMGTSHEIPAIPKEEAYRLRDQIAYFAKIKEVE
ncbi:PH domain-containing protein [Niallia sp.]|uniref:PH domain-containing protein n=1 Tax=Niallia sp. TaxID=2837523 RepID=UPI0028980877|nr:PH domain-containing protein [Niallia sp.]